MARRQFTLLGREADAGVLAMHLLASSQGVATLANAFHDSAFVEREVASSGHVAGVGPGDCRHKAMARLYHSY